MASIKGIILIIAGSIMLSAIPVHAERLLEKREGFETSIVKEVKGKNKLDMPPHNHLFKLVQYNTELGKMDAYITKPSAAQEAKKSPAIIWITGGHPQGGANLDYVNGGNYTNNQTANTFFKRGIITLYPTFRGTFGNLGIREEFYGEVNDTIAALKYLQQQSHIDPNHIYLGGHSTGATLALLVAASTDEFAGVIALGPQDDVKNHGGERLFDTSNPVEFEMRAPINHLASIKTPTFVIEGEYGASKALNRMSQRSTNPAVRFWEVPNADHFDVIQSTSELFANTILKAAKKQSAEPEFGQEQVDNSYVMLMQKMRRANASQQLARAAANGVDINKQQELVYSFYSEYQDSIEALSKALKKAKFMNLKTENLKNGDGKEFIRLVAMRKQQPSNLDQLITDQALIDHLHKQWYFGYDDWFIKTGKAANNK